MARPAGTSLPPLPVQSPRAAPPHVDLLSAALHGGTPPQRIRVLQRSNSDSSDSDGGSGAMLLSAGASAGVRGVVRSRGAADATSPGDAHAGAPLPASPARSSVSSASSASSSSCGASVRSSIHSTVVPVRRSARLRERVSAAGPRKWRMLDASSSAKLFGVNQGEAGPLVMCSSGAVLWSVLPYVAAGMDSARARILHKNGSPFFVVLAAQRWAPRIERKAYGHVHALPHVKRAPELAIEIHGDSIGKRFQVVGHDGSGGPPHIIASGRRSTRFQNLSGGGVEEVAAWDVDVEANVDSAMVAAVLVVLNEWELRPPSSY